MGRVIRCPECGEVYEDLETVETLRDNDGICLVCNAPIEVADWDRVLSSYSDDDYDDVDAMGMDEDDDDEEWRGDVEIDDVDDDDDLELDSDDDEEFEDDED